MKKSYRYLMLVALITALAFSCSTGKKALQKGNYSEAVFKSIERLRSNPDSKKATKALAEAYPLAVQTLEFEIEEILASNDVVKYGIATEKYKILNQMADEIRRSPAALKQFPNPKTYSSQLTATKEKAADEAYQNGRSLLEKGSMEEARNAYYAFKTCLEYNPNYKDARRLLDVAREQGTLKVVVEQLPVSGRYKLSADFFYDQILGSMNNSRQNEFINFMSPKEAENYPQVDQILQMEFFDFQVGATKESQKEKEVFSKDSVKVGTATVNGQKVDVRNRVSAKLTNYTREVSSGGVLQYKVIDAYTNKVLEQKKIPGSFVWVDEWASFNGDERALTKEQLELCKKKPSDPPSPQDLFMEFTRPIFEQTKNQLRNFYRKY